jgi:phospholipase C
MAASFKHLVVLMMENRSFDHILGFLPGGGMASQGMLPTRLHQLRKGSNQR